MKSGGAARASVTGCASPAPRNLACRRDTLFVRLQVSNTGDTDAQNAVINDALTGQTLVAGSINISPLAVNDVFNAVGNTQLLVGGATGFSGPTATFAGNLLSNDTNLAGNNFPGFTLTSTGAFVPSGSGRPHHSNLRCRRRNS